MAKAIAAWLALTTSVHGAVHHHRHHKPWHTSDGSEYGAKDSGGPLACEQNVQLTDSMVLVANKTLPCGTRIEFKVGKRIRAARVEDRGPYSGDRIWDLSWKLARNLGLQYPWSGPIKWRMA